MPERHLQFVKGKSEKFWKISLKGKTHTVVYGRLGTDGRTLPKSFDTPSEAKASYNQLIESKLKKGYVDSKPTKKRTTKKKTANRKAETKQPVKTGKKKTTPASKKKTTSAKAANNLTVALNDLKRPENQYHCQFRNKKSMADLCHYVWIWHFRHLKLQEPWIDLAVWEVGPKVRVRPACSQFNESHRSFVRPHPIFFEVKGYAQERKKIEKQKGVDQTIIKKELKALKEDLIKQMQEAIVKGFQHKQSQKNYVMYNPDDRPLTVLITTEDKGLHASEFSVVWKNQRGPSATQIRNRIAAEKGKKPVVEKQGKSIQQLHLENLAAQQKQEWKEYFEYWGEQKEKADARKPAIYKKLAGQIEKAESKFSKKSPKKKTKKSAPSKNFLFSLDDGNQSERMLFAKVKLDRIVDIVSTYQWSNFDEYDNRIWEYATTFMDPLEKKSKLSRQAFWNKLNRHQKVVHVLLNFTSETHNGGVWQFLFNHPEYSLAALEAMKEIGITKLANDYQKTLEEYFGKAKTITDLRKRANEKSLGTKKQWQAFAEGYQELKSAEKIQKYFYTTTFSKTFYKKISDYIEDSYLLFAKVEV